MLHLTHMQLLVRGYYSPSRQQSVRVDVPPPDTDHPTTRVSGVDDPS